MISFFKVLIGAIKAVPMAIELTNRFIDMWIDAQIADIKDTMSAEKRKLLYLRQKIREAKTDDERIALSIILHDYHSGKMPE
jgi:hypothetical protein